MRAGRNIVTCRGAASAVALALLACSKRDAPPAVVDAGPVVLVPMEIDAEPPLQPRPPAPRAPWEIDDDSDDLPADAGDARCPPRDASAKTASVRLELARYPSPWLDLVVPSLGIRQHLWKGEGGGNPNTCTAGLDASGSSLRFRCTEVMTGNWGKVYARGSDIVIVQRHIGGASATRSLLPCGTVPRFEPVACAAPCARDGAGGCVCSEIGEALPVPATTTTTRR